ncbi:DUF3540 domain-containing protein [Acerihabitans sp. TG2]|uniref:DUF3540 domain-containing protein n=1 Tax=Acerihabitans sp. TG2 TaxID=3096008 RepID=UPI002B228A2E|nr:DUF3540 domain-containing protein [Acerihabitans sp. TG2]MEA9390971.1 DUF3540 domain-containing protein [Acerihabitans sp. TG2]
MITPHSATHPDAGPPRQAVGQVVNILPEGFFIVRHQQRGWQCRLAASCLLQPELGDDVLIAGDQAQLWLLAVLTRADGDRPCLLSVPGDLAITPGGTLTLRSENSLHLIGQELEIKADRSKFHIKSMHYQGQDLAAWIPKVSIVGQRLESVWHTLVQISQRLLRKVTQTEHARVGQLDYQAKDYARIHAQNVIITSEAITKIDSEQIHLG